MIPLLLAPPKVVYRGTLTGLRISAVDGTAFIDNLPYTYSSDFSAGVNSFSTTTGTLDGNIDGISGEDNTLRFTCNTSAGTHESIRALPNLLSGVKYRISLKYYIPSANSNIDGIRILTGNGASYISSILSVTDSWTSTSVDFVPSSLSSGFRIYPYDGAAVSFADAGGDDVFYIKDVKISEIQPFTDGNHSIEIYDSSNRMLKGVLKAAGTSEGLGDELVTGWTNTSFGTFTSSGVDVSSAIASGINKLAYSAITASAGWLLKGAMTITVSSGSGIRCYVADNTGGSHAIPATPVGNWLSNGTAEYKNLTRESYSPAAVILISDGATECSMTGFTLKRVLTPSSSGCTLQKSKSDSTESFSYKNPSFVFNAASYYCIIRAIR